ncbi:MAG: hypothetical protein AAGI22_30160 [Planctomycetota bacterium]
MSLVGFSELIDVGVDQLVIGLGGGPGIGTSYCGPAALNSIGESAEIVATGSTVTSQNDLTLGAIGRLVGIGQIQNGGPLGVVSLRIDLTNVPQPVGPVAAAAGETWNFQGWYRDSVGGSATSNFTDGVSVVLQ